MPIDPTGIAKVGLAGFQPPDIQGMAGMYRTGMQDRLLQQQAQQQSMLAQQAVQSKEDLKNLATQFWNADYAGDEQAKRQAFMQIAAIDPKEADVLRKLAMENTREQRSNMAYNILGASHLDDDEEAQNKLLNTAYNNATEGSFLKEQIGRILQTPFGSDERREHFKRSNQFSVSQGLLTLPEKDESMKEIRKEQRTNLRRGKKQLRDTANTLRSNYSKIENSIKLVEKGSRVAVPQLLVALVKLGDPASVVREAELEMAIGRAKTKAEVFNWLAGKGTSERVLQAIATSFDPLSPETIRKDEIMDAANALLSANIPPIQRTWEEMQEEGEQLTPAGYESIFTPKFTQSIQDLSTLIKPVKITKKEEKKKVTQKQPERAIRKYDLQGNRIQ